MRGETGERSGRDGRDERGERDARRGRDGAPSPDAHADLDTDTDLDVMRRAVAVATTARRRSAPNPWVGCVIVDPTGARIGEGATGLPGGPHAEVEALRAAGGRSRGATAYVTLEPCAHHGRTGPCADALVDAGVARVVSALEDPDPRVAGRGHDRLRSAGIDVSVGVGAAEAADLLRPYLHQRRTGRAFAVLKTAASLDGRTAAADGSSRWITGPEARADAHALRADSQAVVVGSGTALADRPALTVRDLPVAAGDAPARWAPEAPPDPGAPPEPPLRVVLDARGRVPADGPLFDVSLAPTLVVTTAAAGARRVDEWRRTGATVATVSPGPGGRGVDPAEVLAMLAEEHGVIQALVEGGAGLHGSFLAAGLADHLVAYVAPLVLGERGRPVFGVPGPDSIGAARPLRLLSVRPVGGDVRLDLAPDAAPDASDRQDRPDRPGREEAA